MTKPHFPLEFRQVSHHFGARQVLSDIELALNPGEIMCLLGPSGCGKSTTLRIAAGIEEQSSGEIWSGGELLSGRGVHTPPEKRNIGLVFQDFALFPHFTVRDNVEFGVRLSGRAKASRSSELLERVGLGQYENSYPHELSGGEQQRVALARALAAKPKVLLLDEPFSGLDDRLRDTVRDSTLDLLEEEQCSALLVTHDPQEAMRLAHRIAIMRAGKIVQLATPIEIFNSPVDLNTALFFSDLNLIDAKVKDGFADTIIGKFECQNFEEGAAVKIAIAPHNIRRQGQPLFDLEVEDQAQKIVKAFVKRARFLGEKSLVDYVLEDGTELSCSFIGQHLPQDETEHWLSVPASKVHIFLDA